MMKLRNAQKSLSRIQLAKKERQGMINKISKYRNAIMGVAIVWVMVYHSKISFTVPLFTYIKKEGFGGVDIFMFISGFGIYQSLYRDSYQIAFYKRRLKRILPAYLPVLCVFLFIKLFEIPFLTWIQAILGNLTGFSFWLEMQPRFNWYILALFAFYFLSPFLFEVIRLGKLGEVALLIFSLFLDICFMGHYVMIGISRFSIFILGMIAGRLFVEDRQIKKEMEVLAYVCGALGYIMLQIFYEKVPSLMWNYGLYWYPFILIAPGLIFLLCRFFAFLDMFMVGHKIGEGVEKVGNCSLEIYLLHVMLYQYLNVKSNWIWMSIYFVTILCGYSYHKLLQKLLHMCNRKSELENAQVINKKKGIEFSMYEKADRIN